MPLDCSVDGCEKPTLKKGWCRAHYLRNYRHGSPTAGGVGRGFVEPWLEKNATLEACHPEVCLRWPFSLTPKGYADTSKGHAHRIVCAKTYGPAPEGKPEATHSCGVRDCVNPHHLRWASHAENIADKFRHETTGKKLTRAEALAIRANPGGLSIRALAGQYGVSNSTISNIRANKIWKEDQ